MSLTHAAILTDKVDSAEAETTSPLVSIVKTLAWTALAFAILVLVLRVLPPPAAGASIGIKAIVFAVAAALISTPVALIFNASQRDKPWHWANHSLDHRVRNFVDFLDDTQKSLVIVTGCLHHDFYNHPLVVQALQRLPRNVMITVYHEEDFDAESGAFTAELASRKLNYKSERIVPDSISHGAIFDGRHTKIEQFGVPDAAPDKHVDYYAFDRARARLALKDIEAARELEPDRRAA